MSGSARNASRASAIFWCRSPRLAPKPTTTRRMWSTLHPLLQARLDFGANQQAAEGKTTSLSCNVLFSAPTQPSPLGSRREDAAIVVAPPFNYRAPRGLLGLFRLHKQAPKLLERLGHTASNHRGVGATQQDRPTLDHDAAQLGARENLATHSTGRLRLPSSHAGKRAEARAPVQLSCRLFRRAGLPALTRPTRSPSRRALSR